MPLHFGYLQAAKLWFSFQLGEQGDAVTDE